MLGGALPNKTIVPSDSAITGGGAVSPTFPNHSKNSVVPTSLSAFIIFQNSQTSGKNCTSDPSFIIKDTTRRGSQIGRSGAGAVEHRASRNTLCGIRTHHVPSTLYVLSGTCPEPSQCLEIFFLTLKYNFFSALLSLLPNPPIYASQLCFTFTASSSIIIAFIYVYIDTFSSVEPAPYNVMCIYIFRELQFDTRKPIGVFFPGEYLLSCSQLSSLPIIFYVVLRPQGVSPSIHFGIPFLIGLLLTMVLFHFPGFQLLQAVYSCLKIWNQESPMRENTSFVGVGLGYHTHYYLFSFHPLPCKFIISLFFTPEQYSMVYMHHTFIIHSVTEGCLGRFQLLALVNSMAQTGPVEQDGKSFGYSPRSGAARS